MYYYHCDANNQILVTREPIGVNEKYIAINCPDADTAKELKDYYVNKKLREKLEKLYG